MIMFFKKQRQNRAKIRHRALPTNNFSACFISFTKHYL